MFQRDPVAFSRLKALSMRKRMEVANSPDMGPALFSALTPSDLAALFPDYYKRILPNVDGFRRAISAQSAQESASAAGKLEERLSAVERTSASIMTPVSQRSRASAPAQLSPEQAAAFQKIQQGAIGVNSPDAKFFGTLSASQLASIGITKTKDNTGAEVYQYNAPDVGREEAISRLKTASTSQSKNEFFNQVYNEAYNQAKGQFAHPEVIARLAAVQASHETAYGKKAPGNNYFGIKGAGQSFATHEEVGGRSVGMQQSFRTYGGLSDSVSGYLRLMKTSRYREVANSSTIEEAMTAQGRTGYATDSLYSQKLFSVNRSNGGQVNLPPEGQNGQYTEDQINKMIDQLKQEKNETRRQQFANLISNIQQQQGMPVSPDATAVVTGKMQYKNIPDFSKHALVGGVDNFTHYCGKGARIMAGHMYGHSSFINEPLGGDATAGSLSRGNNYFQRSGLFKAGQSVSPDSVQNQAYLESLPIGTVISSTGGRRGQGHAQIKIGPNQWASDTVQSHFLSRGYENFVVHAPNEQGLAALAKNGVDQSSVELPTVSPKQYQTRPGEAPEPQPVAPPAAPQSYEPDIPQHEPDTDGAPSAVVQKPQKEAFQQPQEAPNQQAMRDIQASETSAPTPKTVTFKLNKDNYLNQIEGKYGSLLNAPIVGPGREGAWKQTLDGITETGVTYKQTKDGIEVTLPENDQRIAQVRADMKSRGLDEKAFLESKVNEPPKPVQKQEAPKETPKQQAPQQPTATVTPPPYQTKPGEASEPPPVAPPEPAPKPLPGFSTGGSLDMPDGTKFFKVNQQDNIVGVDPKTDTPIATFKSGETLSSGDNRVDVTPTSKQVDARPEPNPMKNVVSEINNLQTTMQKALETANHLDRPQPTMTKTDSSTGHPNLIGDTNRQIVNQQKFSPSHDRAMHRIATGSEPSGSFQHFSYGNQG